MLAETAKLAIELNLTGNAAAGIRGVEQRLAGLSRQTGQISGGFKTLGAGILLAGVRASALLLAQTGAIAGAIGVMVREGQAAAKVQTIYANAIANSGKVSTQYVGILNAQQTALMNLGGVDDELIKTEQTRLIQMGLTGEQVAKLTPLILDFSKATGVDLLTATKLAGKAVEGNTGALSRYGVMVDKTKAKVDPFGATVDALNSRFKGTTQALSGSLEARLGALRENLANVREEAGMKLLPALTKIVDVAGRKLVPAFGMFVDRILPSVIAGVDKFAAILEGGGAERGIQGITDALGPMVEMLKIAAAPVKLIVDAFLKLPSQVQGVLIGAFAVNKLSGGLIGQGVGQIAKGALGGGLLQRGGSPANPLYVSDVAGGLGAAGAAGKGLGLISKVFLVGEAIGLAVLVNDVRQGISDASTKQSQDLQGQLSEFLGKQPPPAAIENALNGVKQGIVDLESSNLPLTLVQGEALDNLKKMRAELEQSLAEAKGARLTGDLGRHGPMGLVPGTLKTIAGTMTKLQVQMHADFGTAIGELERSNDPQTIAAAAAQIVALIKGGVGSAATTRGAIADLTAQRDAALASGNTGLAATLSAAIKQLDPFATGREWQAKQLRAAQEIKNSNKSVADKVTALKGIEHDLLAHQRTMAAAIVSGLINVVNAVHNIKLPAGSSPNVNPQTGFVIPGGVPLPKPKPKGTPTITPTGFVVNVKSTVTTRDVNTAKDIKSRYGPTVTQAGAA